MGDRKFCCEPIDGVKVPVRLVVVFLLQLIGIKLFILESFSVGGTLLLDLRGMLRRFGSSSSSGGGLGSFEGVRAFLRGSQLFCHFGSSDGLASMGAFRNIGRGHVDALVLVKLHYVDALRDASKALDELSRPLGKGGAHDGAFRGFFGKLRDAGEERRGRGAQSAERGGLCATQKRARRGELRQRRELVHCYCTGDQGRGREISGKNGSDVLYISATPIGS